MNASQQHRTGSKAWIMIASGYRKDVLFTRLKLLDKSKVILLPQMKILL